MKLYIPEWREYKGLTQLDLSVIANVGRETISRIESGGKASNGTVAKLAKGFGIKPEELRYPPPAQRIERLPPQIQLDEVLKGTVTVEGIELTDEMKKELARYARLLKMEAERGH